MPAIEELLGEFAETINQNQTGTNTTTIRTGFDDLDQAIGGLYPGQLITIASRPAVGKSMFSLSIARHVAINQGYINQGYPVLYCTLEHTCAELSIRLASAESRIRLSDLRTQGGMTPNDWDRLERRMGQISDAPLYIDDSSATITDIQSLAREQHARNGLRLLVVDYLQLVGGSGEYTGRRDEIDEITRQLKKLATELHIPVVAVSQLNRGPEHRPDRRPILSDLRASGSIEEVSDTVLIIHRPDEYDQNHKRAGEADLILAKHRTGQLCTVAVAHQLHFSRFANLAH